MKFSQKALAASLARYSRTGLSQWPLTKSVVILKPQWSRPFQGAFGCARRSDPTSAAFKSHHNNKRK